MSEPAVLAVEEVSRSFGKLQAVQPINLAVHAGQVTGIIGPNGSGKTTLFNCLSGVLRPSSGRVLLRGENMTGKRPHLFARKGLGRTFQIATPFLSMSVLENLLVAEAVADTDASRQKAAGILERLRLTRLSDQSAGNLSGGQMKLLELGRILMCDPVLVLLDEIGAGVHPNLKNVIAESVRHYRDQGVAFLLIEHDMEFIQDVCDDIIVMAYGEVIARGRFDEVTRHPRVIDSYLGAELET
jgi:branched-chain amino acid transport system ATP-binding protein